MPDSIINSLSDGFDPQALNKMQLDTKERLNTLSMPLNAPQFQLPDYSIPKELSSGDLLFKQRNNIDLTSLIYSDDPEKQKVGFDALNNQVKNSNSVKNDWSDDVYKYEPFMDRYQAHGYDLQKSQGENEDRYHQIEWTDAPWYKKIDHTLSTWAVKFPLLAISKTLGSLNSLRVMIENTDKIGTGDFWSSVADNETVRWIENQEQKLKDKFVPTYKSIDYDGKGFWSKLGNAETWNDTMVDAAAFMASAFIIGGAAGKLGNLSKATSVGRFFGAEAAEGSLLGKSLQFATGVRNTAGVAAHILNTTTESTMQAVGDYRKVKEDLLKTIDPETGEFYTEDKATKRAGNAASTSFNFNWAILSMSNAFENKWIQKIMNNKGARQAGEILLDKGLNATVKKEVPFLLKAFGAKDGTRAAKFFTENYFGKEIVHYTPEALKGVAFEGFWEENTQSATSRLADQRYGQGFYVRSGDEGVNIKDKINTTGNIFGDFFKQSYKQTIDALKGNDSEISDSIGVGGLIGILGGTGLAKLSGYKNVETGKTEWFKGERQMEEDNTNRKVTELEEARKMFTSISDVFEKDGTINQEKFAAKQDKIGEIAQRMGISNDITNPVIKEQILKNLFAEYTYAHIKAGTADQMLSRLEEYGKNGKNDKDAETLSMYGFSQDLAEDPSIYANLAKQFIDVHDIAQKVTYKPKDTKMSASEYNMLDSFLKSKLYELGSRNIVNDIAIDKINTDIEDNFGDVHRAQLNAEEIDRQIEEAENSKDDKGTKAASLDLLKQEKENAEKELNKHLDTLSKNSLKSKGEIYKDYHTKADTLIQAINHKTSLEAISEIYSDPKQGMDIAQKQFKDAKAKEEADSDVEDVTLSPEKTDKEEEKDKNDVTTSEEKKNEADEKVNEEKEKEDEKNKNEQDELIKAQNQKRADDITALSSLDELNTYYNNLSDEEKKIHDGSPLFKSKKAAILTGEKLKEKLNDVNNTPPPTANEELFIKIEEEEEAFEQPVNTEPFINPLPYLSSLKTANRNSENSPENSDVEIVNTDDEYALFQNAAIKLLTPEFVKESNFQMFIENDEFNVKDVEKELFDTVKAPVIVLRDNKGNNVKVEDLFPDEHKNLHGKPTVFQMDKTAFSQHADQSAVILANKSKITTTQALKQYAEEREMLDKAREKAKQGIPVSITMTSTSEGFTGNTKIEPVSKKYGEVESFSINPLNGDVIVKTPLGDVQAFTPKIKSTPFFADVKSAFSKIYKTEEEAKTAIKFLKNFVYTQKGKFFTPIVEEDGYHIRYVIEDLGDKGLKTNDKLISTGDIQLNISRKAYNEGYTDLNGKDVSFDTYREALKPLLLTNKKILKDKKGNSYTSPINSYFHFQIDTPEVLSANTTPAVEPVIDTKVTQEDIIKKEWEEALQLAKLSWMANVDERGFPKESLQPIEEDINKKYEAKLVELNKSSTPIVENLYQKTLDRIQAYKDKTLLTPERIEIIKKSLPNMVGNKSLEAKESEAVIKLLDEYVQPAPPVTATGRTKRTTINSVVAPTAPVHDYSSPLRFTSDGVTYTLNRMDGGIEDADEMSVFLNISPKAASILEDMYKTYPFDENNKEASVYKANIEGGYTFYSVPSAPTDAQGSTINNEYLIDLEGKIVPEGLSSIPQTPQTEQIKERNCI